MVDVKNLLEAEPALEEVMQLLESVPSSAPVTAPVMTFQLFVNSL